MKYLTPARLSVLMFLIVGGLIAAYVAKNLLAFEAPPPTIATRMIPMAIAELEPGTVVTEAHIGQGPVQVTDLRPDVLISSKGVVGRTVKEKILPAQPIRSTQLYPPGERPPLKVAPGMRAVSVAVGESTAVVEGLIQPGQFVDVHLTVAGGGQDDRMRGGLSMTLFRGIRVIAMNRSYQPGDIERGGNSVTLELTTEQANILNIAQQRGTITLAFNPEGKGTGVVDVSNENRATLEEILNLEPIPEPPAPFRAEVYRGTGRQLFEFQHGRRTDSSTPTSPTIISPPRNADPPPDRSAATEQQRVPYQ